MGDLQVNSDLDVFIDDSGDYAYATGATAFEQKMIITLIDFYNDLVGENDRDTIVEQVKIGARRAVEEVGLLERVANVSARFSDDQPNTLIVDIIFDTGEAIQFGVDETGVAPSATATRVFESGTFESTSSFDVYEDGEMQ